MVLNLLPSIEKNLKSNLFNAFFACDLKQLQKDYHSIKEINVSKKVFLYRQGDRCSDVFWIKNGIVKLSHITEEGTEMTMTILGKWSVIGCFWNNSASPGVEESAQALGEVNFYRIAKNDFKALMSHQTELAWHVFEEIYSQAES